VFLPVSRPDKMRTFVACLLLAVVLAEPVVRFDGHKVLRLSLAPHHLSSVHSAVPQYADWWKAPASNSTGVSLADLRVTSEEYAHVADALAAQGIKFSVMIDDIQALMDLEKVPAVNSAADPWFLKYHNYADTVGWLKQLAQNYSSIADLVTIGTSYGGKTIYGLHITGNREQANPDKPKIFNDGGIHAREWIAPATVGYLLHQLVSRYSTDPQVKKYVDNIDWTMVPIFNVDGYDYTWTTNRMWRKTRAPNAGSSCIGTDPCRNAGTGWGGPGASTDPCSDTYRGKAAYDQKEVKAIIDYVKQLGNVKYYNNYHSYSQLWMGPFGYTASLPPAADFAKQQAAGKAAATAIKASHGLTYAQGPVYATIYPASGILCDAAYKEAGVILSYTCELRDTGRYGFILPPEQIVPQGEEIWAATAAIADYILANPDL